MTHQREIQSRALPVFLLLLAVGIGVSAKVFYIQLKATTEDLSEGLKKMYRTGTVAPVRGRIFSADGHLLATSVPEYELRWDASIKSLSNRTFLEKLDSLSTGLSRIIGVNSRAEFATILTSARIEGNGYTFIAKEIDQLEYLSLNALPLIRDGRYKYGFFFEKSEHRERPFGDLARRTIGTIGKSQFGLELNYNDLLAGRPGKQYEERIGGGQYRPINDNYLEAPVHGADLISTINVHLQDVAANSLRGQLIKEGAEWGTCILMEVKTGYVHALVNLLKTSEGEYSETENIATDFKLEPGSTFKLMTLMAALDDGLIKPSDSVRTGTGKYDYKGFDIKDSNHDKINKYGQTGNGTITVEEVFAKSSNVGTAKSILRAYEGDQQAFLDKINSFGIGEPLGLEFQNEPSPTLRKTTTESYWSGTDMASMSIGYSVSMTPFQLLAFYNGVINGGDVMRPLLVKEIRHSTGRNEVMNPVKIREIPVKRRTIAQAVRMMEKTADTGGTVEDLFYHENPKYRPPYRVGGKTGTAKIFENGTYTGKYRASFVGYFPADEPKYSCLVIVSDPKSGQYYGSTVAAPVFRDLSDKIFASDPDYSYPIPDSVQASLPASKNGPTEALLALYESLDIKYTITGKGEWTSVTTLSDQVQMSNQDFATGTVPNVKGMGLSDALFILENRGLRVQVFGTGEVKRQSLKPGQSVRGHKYITIHLS